MATYTTDTQRDRSMRIIREINAAFGRRGWRPEPFVLGDQKPPVALDPQIDAILADPQRRGLITAILAKHDGEGQA